MFGGHSFEIAQPLVYVPPAGNRATRLLDESKKIVVLPKLPPGRFRSLGGIFDYETWPERDRFLYLDSILASRCSGGAVGHASHHILL